MPAPSAGILLHRRVGGRVEVLLVHPGGPFWARRDAGAWSIPKGEIEPEEAPLEAARREFTEELGHPCPPGEPMDLGEVRLASGKRILAWSLTGDLDPETIVSNRITITLRGRPVEIPEVDRGAWFDVDVARVKLNPGQVPLIDRLAVHSTVTAADRVAGTEGRDD